MIHTGACGQAQGTSSNGSGMVILGTLCALGTFSAKESTQEQGDSKHELGKVVPEKQP